MSDSALSSIVGLIPVAVASGIAVKTTKAMLPDKKRKSKKRQTLKAKKEASRKQVKHVTKSHRKARQDIDKWIG